MYWCAGDKVVSVDTPHWIDGPAPEANPNYAPSLGRLADYVVEPEDLLVRAPSNLDADGASTLPVAGLTAQFALVELGRVRAGRGRAHPRNRGVSVSRTFGHS
jgi:NADPH:quinone reductase-like Zn-dependent oxidoreductase